ncbi:class I SAM-dependent methyltransferase [archaeon]|nr:class I SAM-dependent methyltransferase [archaeon]
MLLREHREQWLAEKAKELGIRGRVLDVGAKEGRHAALFAGCSYEAMDAEPKSSAVRRGDAHKLPYADSSFDCVLLMEVLEHVEDPLKVLQECSRVLKTDSYLLFSTPYLAMPAHGDFWRFSAAGLELLFRKSGLKVVKEEKFGGMLSILATWFETVATARTWGRFAWPFAWFLRVFARLEKPNMSYCELFYTLTKK